MMAEQLPLSLEWPKHFTFDTFVAGESNQSAFKLAQRWPDWPQGVLAIAGPAGSGKTHLACAVAAKAGIVPHKFSDIAAIDWREMAHVILEDGPISLGDEAQLFHVINGVREEGGTLLLTARTPPAQWPVTLPDLKSRLAAVVTGVISEPDDTLLRHMIAQHFSDLGVLPQPGLIDYVADRVERSFSGVEACAAKLNQAALARQSKITTALARTVMGWPSVT
ncbi:MAG: DnaA/Hda family protein [Pseudomonadota bacterium]